MLVEKAQEFPALFLVNERKKDAKGYGSNHGGSSRDFYIG